MIWPHRPAFGQGLKTFALSGLIGAVGVLAASCRTSGSRVELGVTGITAPPISRVANSALQAGSFGYFTKISLFDGPPAERGPTPAISLPAKGSVSPLVRNVTSGQALYGPAPIFQSGPISVQTRGTRGINGTVAASVSVSGIPDGPSPFFYRRVISTCRGAQRRLTGSAVIEGGILDTKYDVETQEAVEKVQIPRTPAPNTERTGTIDHVGDTYRVVFNEQVAEPDGLLTVNAVHLYLLGPAAKGDVIIGQARCT